MSREFRSVLVTHATSSNRGESFGTSGILLPRGWILTHGSLLSPAFFDDTSPPDIRDFLVGSRSRLEKDLVRVPRRVAESVKLSLQYNERRTGEKGDERAPRKEEHEEKGCSLRAAWRCSLLRKTFDELLFSWSFEKAGKFDKSLLSIFLLLKVDDRDGVAGGDDVTDAMSALSDLYAGVVESLEGRSLRRGATVEIESAPFGNACFLDSVSRGVVSNILGENGCVILSDANAVPGCEGAPLHLVHQLEGKRRTCGLVIAPLSWCRGEWVGYTFAANLQPCLHKILRAPDKEPIADGGGVISSSTQSLLPEIIDSLDRSLVVVKCGSSWGTGVVVDAKTGTIITCSHVVQQAVNSRVKVSLDKGEEAWARLVYRTRDGQPYDVAVLRLEQKHEGLRAVELAAQPPAKGAPVVAAGFPFFGAAPASCSRGVVSRVTGCVLQTTCCVQSGASGGPVVGGCHGSSRMLGLVVSNAVSASDAATLYPRFNMAVPAAVIRGPVLDYLATDDAAHLERLSSHDPTVLQTWNFYLTPRSKM